MRNNYLQQRVYLAEVGSKKLQVQMIEVLSQTLFATVDLRIYVRQAQWHQAINCQHPPALLDEIVAVLEAYIELLANSLMALSGASERTPPALPDDPSRVLLLKDQVATLAAHLELYAKLLRSGSAQTASLEKSDEDDSIQKDNHWEALKGLWLGEKNTFTGLLKLSTEVSTEV